ncbi:MAG TPA: hypothetical protein VFM17_06670 [Candidatus Eisenbacteria bacterium]|nr:hypothetical protein [Candidatus Eisenbacteria bacterium]
MTDRGIATTIRDVKPFGFRLAQFAAAAVLLLGSSAHPSAHTREVPSTGFAFVAMWGSHGSGPGEFWYPINLDVSPSGEVYVADLGNRRIQKFDSSGNFIRQWAVPDSSSGEYPSDDVPWGVAVSRDGSVYVGCEFSVTQFTGDGDLVRRWGIYGRTPGRLFYVQDVSVDEARNVYVCQEPDRRWDKFDSLGVFLGEWNLANTGYPKFIEVGPDGRVYVSDHTNEVIQVFASDGTYIRSIAIPTSTGSGTNPSGRVAVTTSGIVYAPDRSEHRIVILNDNGDLIGAIGSKGSGPGEFIGPSCVARDDAGNLYVMDFWNERVQKFAAVTTATTQTTWGALKNRYR